MNVKLLTLSVVMAFSVPVVAEKKNNNTNGLDACAEAMVAQISKRADSKLNYRISDESTGFEDNTNGTDVFYLDAKDSENEEVIARFNCIINEESEVQKLVALPLDAKDARYRARRPF